MKKHRIGIISATTVNLASLGKKEKRKNEGSFSGKSCLLICLVTSLNSFNPFDQSGLLCISSLKGQLEVEPSLKLAVHTLLSS